MAAHRMTSPPPWIDRASYHLPLCCTMSLRTSLSGALMQQALQGLEPKSIWKHSDHIAAIPRPSTKEAAIRQYVLDEAARLGLRATQDAAGNVVVSNPAHPGPENATPPLLTSHPDMDCDKKEGTPLNFDTV